MKYALCGICNKKRVPEVILSTTQPFIEVRYVAESVSEDPNTLPGQSVCIHTVLMQLTSKVRYVAESVPEDPNTLPCATSMYSYSFIVSNIKINIHGVFNRQCLL